MNVKKVATPLSASCLLVIMIIWMAGGFSNKLSPGANTATVIDNSKAVAVVRRTVPIIVPVPASIEAKQATLVSSRILARIEKMHVRAGDTLKKGQLLIELEKTDLQSQVSQSQAQIRAVSARLTEAKQNLSRAKELSDKGVLAAAELDKAQANHDTLIADLHAAEQTLSQAKTTIAFASIHSPIDGRVVDRFAEPGDTAQAGVTLLSLYNPVSLRVEANIPEELALTLHIGQQLVVDIPANDSTLVANVEEMVPAGNAGSRSFLVKSRLDYSEGLLPGMYARVNIPAGERSVLLVPQDRVLQVGQLDVIWLVNNNIVERRLVRTGKVFDDGLIEVVSGIAEGELILPLPQKQ